MVVGKMPQNMGKNTFSFTTVKHVRLSSVFISTSSACVYLQRTLPNNGIMSNVIKCEKKRKKEENLYIHHCQTRALKLCVLVHQVLACICKRRYPTF